MTVPFTIGTSAVCTGANDVMVGANFYADSTSLHGIEPVCATPGVWLIP